jgi:2-polyprenyl-3-methyl-5-hydroxy-6-metoxy-1,4-benzoquinol methylase
VATLYGCSSTVRVQQFAATGARPHPFNAGITDIGMTAAKVPSSEQLAAIGDATARAALSRGVSSSVIHSVVREVVVDSGPPYGVLLDVGCGTGTLAMSMAGLFDHYIGCDIVAYEGFPNEKWASLVIADLNRHPYPFEDGTADIVAAIETIEHLENPRAFVRELVRLARPKGLVVVTTPNQLSLLSKLSLLVKDDFDAFDDRTGQYPAHITALVANDLRRIGVEAGLDRIHIRYTNHGRIPKSSWHWPKIAGLGGKWYSDNVVMYGFRR